MLPPLLAEIKKRLIDKGLKDRSTGEDALLAELTALDDNWRSESLFKDSEEIRKKAYASMISGPANSCKCCGRPW